MCLFIYYNFNHILYDWKCINNILRFSHNTIIIPTPCQKSHIFLYSSRTFILFRGYLITVTCFILYENIVRSAATSSYKPVLICFDRKSELISYFRFVFTTEEVRENLQRFKLMHIKYLSPATKPFNKMWNKTFKSTSVPHDVWPIDPDNECIPIMYP